MQIIFYQKILIVISFLYKIQKFLKILHKKFQNLKIFEDKDNIIIKFLHIFHFFPSI
jgi:hypothetical protein